MPVECRIAGFGSRLGKEELTAEELCKRFSKPVDVHLRNAGTEVLHYIPRKADDMSADGLIGMSVMAAADAMEQAHVRYGDIDAIFAGSSGTCRRRWPEYAVQVGYLMGSRNMPRETVSRGCGGGVAALVHAKRYIETHWNPGRDVTCLVFAGDRITDWLNPADYGTCALFSDGAAATVVTTKGNASDDGLGQYLIEAADATNIASGEFAMSLENNNDVKKIISAWTARLYTGLPCSGHFRLPHGC